jgi:hypothetical protein
MKHLIFFLGLATLLFACAPKNVYDLSETGQRRITDLLAQRNQCFAAEAQRLDDGVTDASKLADMVASQCAYHEENIQNVLQKEFGMELGPAWGYVNNLRMQAPNQIMEAILAQRKAHRGQ